MNYQRAYELLEKYGQLHVLKYYEEISQEEQKELLAQVKEIDYSLLDLVKHNDSKEKEKKEVISPLTAMEIQEINGREKEFETIGEQCIILELQKKCLFLKESLRIC